MDKAKLLLLDVIGGTGFKVVYCSELEDYYKHLKCRCFDITCRELDGRSYDIFCDDEGLFVEDPITLAITADMRPALVGNLIFAHHDDMGNTTSLEDDDFQHIINNSIMSFDVGSGKLTHVIWGVSG